MNIVTVDFETMFSDDYTLSKLTTEAYIRDPRFSVHGLALLTGDDGVWISEPTRAAVEAACDWESTAVLAHHAAFDGLILSHCYGIVPARWLDTYSMAAMLFGPASSRSLEALGARFGLDPKSVPYALMKGRPWLSLSILERRQVADGALQDCRLTYELFLRMMNGEECEQFPLSELPVIDLTIRMFTEPQLEGDRELLRKIYDDEILSKNERLYALGVGESELASADKFAKILEREGVEVAYKKGKIKDIPALAKTDQFMTELLNHDDPQIRELAQARLDVKSSIAETRSARLGAMADRGRLCVYLHYCGAHTRRWSGGDGVNFQNLGRQSDLRRAIRAPQGYRLACPDLSQVECRILNWFAGQEDVVERFRDGHDPYIPIASKFYKHNISKHDAAERGTGKQLELSCGYGAGAATIIRTAARGTYGPPVYLTEQQGEEAKQLYRAEHPHVVALWREADKMLKWLASRQPTEWGFFEIRDGRIIHPNGTWLDYTGLKWSEEDQGWRLYGPRGQWSRAYGAKLVENVVQWLARIVIAEKLIALSAAGYSIVGMAHDDLWLLIPERDDAEEHRERILAIMSETPEWAPGLPLAAECKISKTYGG